MLQTGMSVRLPAAVSVVIEEILLSVSRQFPELISGKTFHPSHVIFIESVHVVHDVLHPGVDGKSTDIPQSEQHYAVRDLGADTAV